ncbi:MAG: hypothetical protein IPK19_24660 [Chloroflexi bacterium]|nr:hypothetical protein [Chloroflexota bacterium]
MANNADRGRKLLIRTALATGVTVATLIGAQNLALLDRARFDSTGVPTGNPELILVPRNTEPVNVVAVPATSAIRNVAPNLVILRQPGIASASNTAVPSAQMQSAQTTGSILPPNPIALSAPDPVIVQQPGQVITVPGSGSVAQPVQIPATRSSR